MCHSDVNDIVISDRVWSSDCIVLNVIEMTAQVLWVFLLTTAYLTHTDTHTHTQFLKLLRFKGIVDFATPV